MTTGTARQLTLQGIDMRPLCAICNQPSSLLGQYSPLWPWLVCRACSLAQPYPIDVFEPDPDGSDRSGLRIRRDADQAARERRVWCDETIKLAAKGQLGKQIIYYKFNLSGRELRNPLRRDRSAQYFKWAASARLQSHHRQLSLPVCDRCGCAHQHWRGGEEWGDWASRCPRCDDEVEVEALYRHRGIFGSDDAESILDRIYKASPRLFEHGVLPDYWFKLMAKEQQQ